MVKKYVIFDTNQPGIVWATITDRLNTQNDVLAFIVKKMQAGKYTKAAKNLRLVPDTRDSGIFKRTKKSQCITLGELVGI